MLENHLIEKRSSVGVYLRLCPPKSKYTFIESLSKDKKSIQIAKDFEIRNFKFDKVFIPTDKQLKVFMKTCTNVLKGVVNGLNGCILAYGQTGSGKTYTILGQPENNIQGILQYSLAYLLSSNKNNLTLEISAVEIYMNKVFDIFCENNNKIPFFYTTRKGAVVKDLFTYEITNTKDLEKLLKIIFVNRKTKKTRMNARSSRSHAIFRVKIYNPEFKGFNFLDIVDLAGSERVKKSQIVDPHSMEETISINTSLMALGKCINFLSKNISNISRDNSFSYKNHSDRSIDRKVNGSFLSKRDVFKHIPYRDSKLTMLLQNCLNGKSLLSLIVAISPDDYNVEESFSSLRFASNCMDLEIKPVRNKKKVAKKKKKKKKSPEFAKVENYDSSNQTHFEEKKIEYKSKKIYIEKSSGFTSNKSVKNSEEGYYTNFTFQGQEEHKMVNFKSKGRSEPINGNMNENIKKMINSEKHLINRHFVKNNEHIYKNDILFEENSNLKKENEKLLREIENFKFLHDEMVSKESEKKFNIQEKNFEEVWKKVDFFLFKEKKNEKNLIHKYCNKSKKKIMEKDNKIKNLNLRANLLEKLCFFNFYENFEDNVRAYFAAKKIIKFWKRFKNLNKKNEREFNDFQKIKIQMGKSMLTKLFTNNEKLLNQINKNLNSDGYN